MEPHTNQSDQDGILDALLHLRYKPKREKFKGLGPSPGFDYFDWVIWLPDNWSTSKFSCFRPKYVLCLAHEKSLSLLCKLRFFLNDTKLVIAGADTNLSAVTHYVEKIAEHCRVVFYEAKDIQMSKVESFSMGFISFYLERADKAALEQLVKSCSEGKIKKSGVLAAWGGIWKHLDDSLEDRRNACAFLEKSDWITRQELTQDAYWDALGRAEFIMAPAGQGIQAPKLAEAWLVSTVPIVTSNPTFLDLRDKGYPMLIVEKWDDLSPKLIHDYRASTLSRIDWEKVRAMLTFDHFQREVLGQEKRYSEKMSK